MGAIFHLRYFPLAAHGIEGDNAVFQLQQGRNGGDFIAFIIHLPLSQYHVIAASLGADPMNGAFPVSLLKRAPHRLAIHGNHFAIRPFTGGSDPRYETAL